MQTKPMPTAAVSSSLRSARLIALVASALAAAFPASARTWTVMKDGSGDFTVIQHAIDAAASGDVIQIGPGRFEEVHTVQFPTGTVTAHCRVFQESLILIGAGPDMTMIGPVAGPATEFSPDGITTSASTRIEVRNLTVENTSNGVNANGPQVTVQHCTIRGTHQGIDSVAWEGTLVQDCAFINSQDAGIVVFQGLGATNVLIEQCDFLDGQIGVDLQSQGGMVRNCRFVGQTGGGLQLSFGAQATIETCTFEDMLSYGVVLTNGSHGTLLNNLINVSIVNVGVFNSSHLAGSGNILMGGTYETIDPSGSTATFDFHGNHILNAGGWTLGFGGSSSPRTFDFTNNWWGTPDRDQIDAWIHQDKNGAPNVFVVFEPFHGMPIGTERRSFGDLKAQFGGGRR